MPRWLKVVLAVGASGALLLGLAIGGFVWWVNGHREDLRKQGAAAEAEGREFGAGKGSHACIDESLARLEHSTTNFVQSALLRMFLKSCLQSATQEPALCAGVPSTSEMFQSAIWRTNTCTAYGKQGHEGCANLLGAIQEVCRPSR